jgi:DNA helicase II / ATP-dependent DNA helicase PcrA
MHQAKGLQFPFVFVGHMGEDPQVSIAHRLETQLSPFATNPARSFVRLPEAVRAELERNPHRLNRVGDSPTRP